MLAIIRYMYDVLTWNLKRVPSSLIGVSSPSTQKKKPCLLSMVARWIASAAGTFVCVCVYTIS